jgi:PadR family transcriptional regulator, regulatory protein AphA
MSNERLTSTSYLVLGLLAREGPSTPYALERHVGATLGHFWSFPHALLYSEPARLSALGLVTEQRESGGRQRRIFAITAAGRASLGEWLARPAAAPTQLRDIGLLQLFFAEQAPVEARLRLAEQQLAAHRARLRAYEDDARIERRERDVGPGQRTIEHWRGETLQMGLLYEQAAVTFWEAAVARAAPTDDAPDSLRRGGSGRAPALDG